MDRRLQRADTAHVIAHLLVLAAGLTAFLLGIEYWWLALVVGYVVVVPLVFVLVEERKRARRN
ncbi:hypothetical protein [Haloarchaeobius sp. TZWWS8]|uniref:hypothetical protein n=1 Tax=Haloarchaeobius sp. TZWWS8 TaxID=3446121 RepID=UPI003EBFD65E